MKITWKHKKYHKKENTLNNMITETCGIGANIKNFLINCPDEIQDSKEIEENFLKKINMSKETFNRLNIEEHVFVEFDKSLNELIGDYTFRQVNTMNLEKEHKDIEK